MASVKVVAIFADFHQLTLATNSFIFNVKFGKFLWWLFKNFFLLLFYSFFTHDNWYPEPDQIMLPCLIWGFCDNSLWLSAIGYCQKSYIWQSFWINSSFLIAFNLYFFNTYENNHGCSLVSFTLKFSFRYQKCIIV